MADVDVAVVGAAGGPSRARTLHRAGGRVVVLEAGDAVGGRVRTDEVDGFRLDRGFQVMLTGYPELRVRMFDLDALDPRAFSPGVTVRGGAGDSGAWPTRPASRSRRWGPRGCDPAGRGAAAGLASPRPVHAGDALATAPQSTTAELLEGRGFSRELREAFFRPFLAGTFFDDAMATSSRLTELVFRCFFRGDVAVPALGMQRLPEQLASELPAEGLRLSSPVDAIEPGAVVGGAGRVTADHVVVATEAPAAARLLGDRGEVRTTARATATCWYGTAVAPVAGPDLVLGADDDGPVATVAPMSQVSADYAPPGQHLVAASTANLPDLDDAGLDRMVRAQLRAWWGSPVDRWRLLRVDRIPYAQPRMDPSDLPALRREVRVDDRLWVCGDHRDTASLQGAMVSGRRTAEAILAAG